LLAALVVLVPVAVAGCGGSGKSATQTKGNLGVTDNLKVAQDQADIQEFCNFAPSPKGDLYNRALISVVAATDDLLIVYRKHPDGIYYDALKKREIKLTQLASDLSKTLSGCGKDGKKQASKLTAALQTK
jgi:hypothetical protein